VGLGWDVTQPWATQLPAVVAEGVGLRLAQGEPDAASEQGHRLDGDDAAPVQDVEGGDDVAAIAEAGRRADLGDGCLDWGAAVAGGREDQDHHGLGQLAFVGAERSTPAAGERQQGG
jgi:hypothetical protein